MLALALIVFFSCLVVGEGKCKKAKMKNQCQKGLLIPWLREALDRKLYAGLGWENEELGIFYIVWTHKSAEHWSLDILEPFIAWAKFKGKLTNKNPKTLKATFRCALNSKKDELRELKRQKNRRLWQFIDPKLEQGKLANKKGPKPNSKRMTAETNNRVGCELFNSLVDSSSEAELFGYCMLPSFNSFFNNYEDIEMYFDFEDFLKSSEEKTKKKRRCRTECKPIDSTSKNMEIEAISDAENRSTNCFSPVQIKTETQSRTDKLPPFKSIHSFHPPTPPYQDNEIFFTSTEYSVCINSADSSRLTPPLDVPPKNYSIESRSSPYHQQPLADVWQPNCWSISSTQQSFNSMNQFSSDLDELSETAVPKSRGGRLDLAEMDQYVPVMNTDNQVLYRDEPISSPSKPVSENIQMSDQMRLEDLLFSNHYETWEKIYQELSSLSVSPDSGEFGYNS